MDEEKLIERMKHGDEEAFTRIYEKYRELVYRTACLIMGDADPASRSTESDPKTETGSAG